MRRVAILTTFTHFDPAYSLTSVVRQQIQGLKRYGYDPIFIAVDSYKDNGEIGVPVRRIPQLVLEPYRNNGSSPTFEADVSRVAFVMEKVLFDVDVVIAHDLHFQEWFVPYNQAIRIVSELLPRLRWLHFTHSAPSPWQEIPYPHSLRYEMMPNSKIVYLNQTDHIRCVEMYRGAELDDVVVVPNPMDTAHFLGADPQSADVVCVYPFSATRMEAKGVRKVIRLLGEMKKLGRSVKFIAVAAHANAPREVEAIREMRQWASERGITEDDMIWTSDKSLHGVSPNEIRNFFHTSNLFVLPSDSENCSLTLLEAALTKNLCVLNKSFRPMADQLGVHAMYFDFGALGNPVVFYDEENWYREVAMLVLYELEHSKALQAARVVRQNHSIDWMMKNTLGPLIEAVCTR